MIKYLKGKYREYKWYKEEKAIENTEMLYRIDFRNHPTSIGKGNFNRYEAIVYAIKYLTYVGAITNTTCIEVDTDGKWVEFKFKRKYFKDVLEVQRKVY